MDEEAFQDLIRYSRASIQSMNAFGRILTEVFTPLCEEIARAYRTLPPEVKAHWGDYRSTHVMAKKIRKARRLGLLMTRA